ncbi:MAG: hypothetical protein ACPGSD_12200 [Flavobacteriales bacterium]|jgi:hypothetical protein
MSLEIDYIGQLEKIAFNRFGKEYMEIVAKESGFKLNNIERIFRNKYKLKLGDFVTLCESLNVRLELKESKDYPDSEEVTLMTDDGVVNYQKKE